MVCFRVDGPALVAASRIPKRRFSRVREDFRAGVSFYRIQDVRGENDGNQSESREGVTGPDLPRKDFSW